jgi:predicted neuraminidase
LLLSRLDRSVSARLLLAVLVSVTLGWLDAAQRPPVSAAPQAAASVVPAAQAVQSLQRVAGGPIPMPAGMAAAHASSLLAMPAGSAAALSIFWFSGDRESGPNVQIAASQFDRATQQWLPARFVVNRHVLGLQLGFGVRRLGNPVAWLDGNGRMHLFVVATGGGGWAASRIVHLRQSSQGNGLHELAFEPVRVLPLSWLWDTSFLVRNAPLQLADGGMVLPVHFELGIKYPSAVRFDKDGAFMGLVRVSARPYMLQPTLLVQSPQNWLALMRDGRPDGKVTVARTLDGGQHWVDLPDLLLDNPDAAVAGWSLAPGQLLLAHNSSRASRATLDLSSSANGRDWTRLHNLAHGSELDEFSYPAMVWADGSLWISYTVDRARIDWQRFGAAPRTAGGTP